MLDEVVRSGSKPAPYQPFKSPLTSALPLPPGYDKVRSDAATYRGATEVQRRAGIGTLEEPDTASFTPSALRLIDCRSKSRLLKEHRRQEKTAPEAPARF